MRAAELFVRCLENEAAPFVFGVPGEENLDVMDALLDSTLRFVQTRHEQGAAFMADVQGRLTGKASVCLATLGPGATNLVTGVADAQLDRAPLVAVTGQAGISRLHKESHQVLDLVALFNPLTKYSQQLVTPEIIPEVVRKAFKVAQTEKYGATHIDFPEDVAKLQVEGEPLLAQQPYDAEPLMAQLKRAAELINAAKMPVIIAGNGVIRGHASDALRRFVEATNVPVANTFMAKGVVPYTDPRALLSVGLQAQDYVSYAIAQADVVVTIGYDLIEYPPERWNPNADKTIVHIDRQPAEVDAFYVLGVGIVADLSITLDELSSMVEPRDIPAIVPKLRDRILTEQAEAGLMDGHPVTPQRVLHDVRAAMGPDDILISDVGAHKMWAARLYPCLEPNTCIISNGFASMGIALPGAIGAKLLFPERRVLALNGDGGFLMNSQEMETAVRVGANIVVLVWRDETFGLIKWKQLNQFGRASHIDFGNPDFVQYARSFGWAADRVESASELAPALEAAFNAGRPALIDVPVDATENLKLTERLEAFEFDGKL
ncbi:MAG: acetolactate synthase large subunit [Dehalococcoidia bacterium]|jgi:acetolactate synthase I/II/III large subunit|nr:acetolactate synthase large subunit [Dehalococcoidia bacterium]